MASACFRCGSAPPQMARNIGAGGWFLGAVACIASASASTGGASSYTASNAGKSFAFSPWKVAGASWYGGPSLWGAKTACGQTLRPGTVGVAHKKLPCGSKVLIGYRGRYLMTTVIDRGPYVGGRSWDLTNGARKALKFDGVGDVRSAVVKKR